MGVRIPFSRSPYIYLPRSAHLFSLVFICRANMAHARQLRPDSAPGLQVRVLKPCKVVPSSLGDGSTLSCTCKASSTPSLRSDHPLIPLSSEYGTPKAVEARFWPWISGKSHLNLGPAIFWNLPTLLQSKDSCTHKMVSCKAPTPWTLSDRLLVSS